MKKEKIMLFGKVQNNDSPILQYQTLFIQTFEVPLRELNKTHDFQRITSYRTHPEGP